MQRSPNRSTSRCVLHTHVIVTCRHFAMSKVQACWKNDAWAAHFFFLFPLNGRCALYVYAITTSHIWFSSCSKAQRTNQFETQVVRYRELETPKFVKLRIHVILFENWNNCISIHLFFVPQYCCTWNSSSRCLWYIFRRNTCSLFTCSLARLSAESGSVGNGRLTALVH